MKNKSCLLKKSTIGQGTMNRIRIWKLFSAVILLFAFPPLSAQNIFSLESYLATLGPDQAQQLQSLVNDKHPCVYLKGGELTTHGNGAPEVARCDAASVTMLYDDNPVYNQVELIVLKIKSSSEQEILVDLAQLQGFTYIQYLLVVFAYDACGGSSVGCLPERVAEMVEGDESPVIVLYKLSITE